MNFTFTIQSDNIKQLNSYTRGPDAHLALWCINQQIFRPARKHGYNCAKLNKLIEENEGAGDIIELLEQKFFEIISEYNLDLD